LGNGLSRRQVDLSRLEQLGTVYGCNALYREFRPTVLVATDRDMAQEIEESGYPKHNVFYTRRPTTGSGALQISKQYFGYSSGPVALSLAAADRHDPVYLLGFDLGPNESGRFNNCYAGTPCYKPQGSEPTFTGNWIKQLIRVVKDHDTQSFVRVMGDVSARIPEFDAVGNLATMRMGDFLAWLNKREDPA
jgi:hypothetical protein